MEIIKDHIPYNTPCNRRPNSHECRWVDIKDYEGHYQISCCGKVKSIERTIIMKNGVPRRIKEKIIGWKKKDNGYFFTMLYRDGKGTNRYIHRLVAENFIPNENKQLEVNHKDGDKGNNKVSNLEWVTHSNNLSHAYMKGLKKSGEEHQQSKLSNADVLFIRENYKPFDDRFGSKPLSARFGVNKSTISCIARNIKRNHG